MKVLLALLLMTGMALAHSWYPSGCCREGDCRPVACSEISGEEGWLKYQGMYAKQTYPSQDENCHVCVIRGVAYGWPDYISCLFTPRKVS